MRSHGIQTPTLIEEMEEVVDYVEEPEVKTYLLSNDTQIQITPDSEIKKPLKDPLQRNKRLFGALMGHLDSAKKLLERDSVKIEQQVQTKSIAVERNQQQSLKLAELFSKIKETELKKVRSLSNVQFNATNCALCLYNITIHILFK